MHAMFHNTLVASFGLFLAMGNPGYCLAASSPTLLPVVTCHSLSPPTSGLQMIAPGEYQCFYLVDGKILGAGSNRCGQLGIGMGAPYPPVPPREIVVPANVAFIDVAAGG